MALAPAPSAAASPTSPDPGSRVARPAPPSAGRVVGLAALLAALVGIVVVAFSWPAVTAQPRDVPIVVVGPEPAVAALSTQLAERSGDLFELTSAPDRDAAVAAIRTRDAVGAIVLGESPELLTASAAGPAGALVPQLADPLRSALAAQAQADPSGQGAPVLVVTDVVPYAESDAGGLGMNAAFFPLLLGGMIGGVGLSMLVASPRQRVLAVAAYAVVGGPLLAGILQGWFGSLQGSYWLNAGAFVLSLAAIAAPIVGFVAVLGRAGLALGPVVMMLFANPISGAALPASYLPGAWGAIGQCFPPGASATLVRTLAYFPDADTRTPWLVLSAWTLGGLLLAAIARARSGRGDRTSGNVGADG
ncbi:hypothetical protein [Salana multivorans]